MKLKFILIFFLLSQSLYSESNFAIALRGGKSIEIYSGIHKWEFDDKNVRHDGLGIGYISKPIIIWAHMPIGSDADESTPSIGISHLFPINPYIGLSLSGLYWEDKTQENVPWRGPNRRIGLGFHNRVEVNEKAEYFWGINRRHYNYNFGYADATSIGWSVHVSLDKGFSIEPWLSIWKWDNYDAERGLGISFSYKFTLN